MTIPRVETPVAGPWKNSSHEAEMAAATQVSRQILRQGETGSGSGLLSSGRLYSSDEELVGNIR